MAKAANGMNSLNFLFYYIGFKHLVVLTSRSIVVSIISMLKSLLEIIQATGRAFWYRQYLKMIYFEISDLQW
jgi:hypothetical protein